MALKFPDKSKGIPYDSTELKIETATVSTAYTSGDVTSPYDVFMDYGTETLVFGYSSVTGSAGGPDHNESMRRIPRSIITYIQNELPHYPEIGDIWLCPSASQGLSDPDCILRIFRTSFTWQCWGVNSGVNTFQLDALGNIEPTVAAWDIDTDPLSALFIDDGNGDIESQPISASEFDENNLFESDGLSAVMPKDI